MKLTSTSRALALCAASAASAELLLARASGGPLAAGDVVLAVIFGALLAAGGALAGRASRVAAALYGAGVILVYSAGILLPALFGRSSWVLPGLCFAGAVLIFALGPALRGEAAPPGPRAGAAWVWISAAATWAILGLADSTAPPQQLLILAGGAAVAGVALGRWSPLLAALALWPGSTDERWVDRAPPPNLPDVLLVTVDTLRMDRAEQMRAWDALMAAPKTMGWRAQAPSPWTLPSLATLMTGLEPHNHGAGRTPAGFSGLRGDARTLAEIFSDAGFDTAATVESPFGDERFGLQRGFERFRLDGVGEWGLPRPPAAATARPLGATLAASLGLAAPAPIGVDRRIADVEDFVAALRDRPMFVWVHILDPHLPYTHALDLDLPLSERIRLATTNRNAIGEDPGEEALAVLRGAYDHEVTVVDHRLERLWQTWPEERNLITVLTSDHGEAFGEHGGWEHGHSMYQELLEIPLIISGIPGLQQQQAGLVDVLPTLLTPMNLPFEADGRDLRRLQQVPYRSANTLYGDLKLRAVRAGDDKLIAGSESLHRYDLAADPGELSPLDGVGILEAWLPPPELTAPGEVSDVDGDLESSLRSLGYLE